MDVQGLTQSPIPPAHSLRDSAESRASTHLQRSKAHEDRLELSGLQAISADSDGVGSNSSSGGFSSTSTDGDVSDDRSNAQESNNDELAKGQSGLDLTG